MKINLVIADNDAAYMDRLERCLADRYTHRLRVFSFTCCELLLEYLGHHPEDTDILVIAPSFYNEKIRSMKINTRILLSEGRLDQAYPDAVAINKYQTGDNLVGSILNIFTENNPHFYQIEPDEGKTKIISVYSPTGGCGKTCIAVSAAVGSASRGKQAFYLSFESTATTGRFFDTDSTHSISRAILHLKAGQGNPGLKLEAIKAIDPHSGVHYFSAPENPADFWGIQTEDYEALLQHIRAMNSYDLVFVDLDSVLDEKALKIMNASDLVLVVTTQDYLSSVKLEKLASELKILEEKSQVELDAKIKLVVNKANPNRASEAGPIRFNGRDAAISLPKVSPHLSVQAGKVAVCMNNEFGEGITQMLAMIDADRSI